MLKEEKEDGMICMRWIVMYHGYDGIFYIFQRFLETQDCVMFSSWNLPYWCSEN